MKTTIRRGFATLAAAGMLGAGLMLGTGTAQAGGGHHHGYDHGKHYYNYDKWDDCGGYGFHGHNGWVFHYGYWSHGKWNHGWWEYCGCK